MLLRRSAALLLAVVAGLATVPAEAASIPAWLDQAIADWNKVHTARPIEFVDIKDQFVWYRLAKSGDREPSQARASVYAIAEKSGYKTTTTEELVTTAKPPVASGAAKNKKCWSRSFTQEMAVGQERLLTSLLCDDGDNWMMGFRVIQ